MSTTTTASRRSTRPAAAWRTAPRSSARYTSVPARLVAIAVAATLLVMSLAVPTTLAVCTPLQGSTQCLGYPANIGVSTNLTWAMGNIRKYFSLNGTDPTDTPSSYLINDVKDFDSKIMADLIAKIKVNPLLKCEVPKDYVQYYRAFICTWLVHASVSDCPANDQKSTILCATSTISFFDSIALALNDTKLCPDTADRPAAIAKVQDLQKSMLSTDSVGQYYNGLESTGCIQGRTLQGQSLCGYGNQSVACSRSCAEAKCSVAGTNDDGTLTSESSGLSTGAIVGIVIGVLALLLILAGAAYFIWRRRKVNSDAAQVKLDGRHAPRSSSSPSGQPVISGPMPAPTIDLSIPDSPLVQTPMIDRFGRQSFVPPAASENPYRQSGATTPNSAANPNYQPYYRQLEAYQQILDSGVAPAAPQEPGRSAAATAAAASDPEKKALSAKQQKTLSTVTGLTALDPQAAVDMLSAMVRDDPGLSGPGTRSTINTEPMAALSRLVNNGTPPIPPLPAAVPPVPADPPESAGPGPVSAQSVPSSIKGKIMHVNAHFEPDLSDELGVTLGDRVKILKVFDDAWALAGLLSPHDEIIAKGMIPLCVFDEFAGARASSVVSGSVVASDVPLRRMSQHYQF
ncbi:hypothetical protein GGF32_009067 [Allomyces javanicus]|nr:hypothetical protein GGF32_009067 [Allomyces javanicus]